MITLSSTDSLEAYMAEALATTQPVWDVAYYDNKNAETDITEYAATGDMNSTTDVSLVSAPDATYNRNITHIIIHNVDTIAHTIYLQKDISGTEKKLFTIYLQPNETWEYPRPESEKIRVINKKTSIGRTITDQADDIELTDIDTTILANFTGNGLQTLTIQDGIHAVGDSIRVLRRGNSFKIAVETPANQEISTNCYSGVVNTEVEILYVEDSGGKEQWVVIGGNYVAAHDLQTSDPDALLGVYRSADYFVYIRVAVWRFTADLASNDPKVGGCLIYVEDLNTGAKRCLTEQLASGSYGSKQARGLYYLPLSERIVILDSVPSTSGNASMNSINNTGNIKSDIVVTPSNSWNSPHKWVEYTKSGVINALGVHNTSNAIREYTLTAGTYGYTSGRYLTVSTQEMISGCWDGVDSTGAGTAYVLISKTTGGLVKVDINDLSVTATAASLSYCIFLHNTAISGQGWYIRSVYIGVINFSDLSYTEYNVGFSMPNWSYLMWAAFMDENTGIIYAAEQNGYRYVELDTADPTNFVVYDLTADLDSHSICALWFDTQTLQLGIIAYKLDELSRGYVYKKLIYQK